MLRKILIVEDNEISRKLLHAILGKEYDVIEAENGEEALAILHKKHKIISAVLLDIEMPVLDGYEVLSRMRSNAVLSQIPVIVATGSSEPGAEVKALSLGANDFTAKPYDAALILHSLRNTISLRETASIVNAIRRDKLSGLYNRESFFDKATAMIQDRESGYYIMACFDIDNFKLINDRYGAAEGDRILRHIGRAARECFTAIGGISGRISADNFAALYPAGEAEVAFVTKMREKEFVPPDTHTPVAFSVGRYVVTDTALPATACYDRAYIAKQSVKGRYDNHTAYFSECMREKLLTEQEIVGDMDAALLLKQFEVWFQPKINHATGALIGAEALVRWRHPQRGLISPEKFIPVFEQNGFVYEMDKYVWERTCRYLRKWIDAGYAVRPVSVNISRYDLFKTDLIEVITGLIDKYDIPVDMLRLEITESAFTKSSEQIIDAVKRLMNYGLTMEIDDFGSGYSSLNTLKDVPANTLKLDMRFLESKEDGHRGGNILESVVRMAKWLGMSVIAEGVETREQADFLKSIGCSSVQGYLYARPMPAEEYEALIQSAGDGGMISASETFNHMDNNVFWDPTSVDTLIFNSFVGGACVFEYKNGSIEMLRANDKYAGVIGSAGMTLESALRLKWEDHLDEAGLAALKNALHRSVETGDEVTEEFVLLNLPGCPERTYLRSTMRVISSLGERYLVYCTNENITARCLAEQREHKTAQHLQAIMDNINGGVTATVMTGDAPRILFANEQFYGLLGYTKAQYEQEVVNPHDLIHPDDRARVAELTKQASLTQEPFTAVYRIICRDGAVRWLQSSISVAAFADVDAPVQLAVASDITKLRAAEERERIALNQVRAIMDDAGSGITAATVTDGKVRLILANDKYYEILGYTGEQYEREVQDAFASVHPDDRAQMMQCVIEAYREQKSAQTEYRVIRRDGEVRWVRAILTPTEFAGVEDAVQLGMFTDITAQRHAAQELYETDEQLKFLNETAHDLLAQPDSERGIEATLKKLLDYFDGNRAYVFEFDYQNAVSNNTYEVCAEGVSGEKERLQNVPMEIMSFWLHAFDRQRNISIADVNALDDSRQAERQVLSEQGIQSLIAVPLWRDGTLIGFIGIDDPHQKQAQVDRLAALGDYIAVMLTRRDLDAKILNDNKTLLGLMNDTPGGFVRMRLQADGTAVPIYFNDGFYKLVGMNHDELMALYGQDATAGVHPDDIEVVREAVNRMRASGEARSAKYRLRYGGGGYIWVMIFGRMTKNEADEVFFNIYYTDVSEQARLDEKREELLENLPCGAGIYEVSEGRIRATYLNKRYRAYLKRDIGDLSEAPVFDVVHNDDRKKLQEAIRTTLTQGREVSCDIRIMDGKGGYLPFRLVGSAMERSEGKNALYVTFMPISKEEQTYSEMLPVALAAVIGSSSDLAFVKDRNHRYVCCSHAFALAAGLSDEKEIVGKTDEELVDKKYADQYHAEEDAIIESGEARLNYEALMPTGDGSIRYASTSKYPLLDSSGSVIGIYGVTRDITEAREADSQLKLLTDSIPGGLATYACTPKQTRIVYFNDGFCKLFGFTREEYAKKSASDPTSMLFAEDRSEVEAQLAALIHDNTPMECVYRAHVNGGGYKWISHKALVADRQGDTVIVNAVLLDVTEQEEATERLRISEEEHRLAVRHSGTIIGRFNVDDRTLILSPDVAKVFALPEKLTDVPYGPVRIGTISQDSADAYIKFYERILHGDREGVAIFQKMTKAGWRWFEAHFSTIYSVKDKPVSAVISFYDVTERLEKETVYKKWQQSMQDKDPASYTLFRSNLTKDVSEDAKEGSLLQITFDSSIKAFNDRTEEYAAQCVFEEDRDRYRALLNSDTLLANYYRGKRAETLEYREKLPAGGVRWLRLSVDLLEPPNSNDVEAYLMYENIDDSKREELLTIERAETDPLTGLLNRYTFTKKVEQIIRTAGPRAQHALLMLDIDGFKQVNDVFGHGAGDQALVDLAGSLRAALRRGDLLGRLGGDEFVVFLKDIPNDGVARHKAKQICALARKSFSMEVYISASVGIAVCPRDGADFGALYKKADAALYHVKGSGKDSYAFYLDDMEGEHLVPEAGAANAVGAIKSKKKRRMLIVDDNAVDNALLSNLFKDEFLIEKAKDGNTALIRLRHYGSAISVVLLDLVMPGMDGFAVLEKRQSSAEMQSIPVIVVSGDDNRETSLRAIRCGATDFVIKPVDADLLRIRVQSAISKAENERLRAQNSFLELQSEELSKYRIVLERTGTVLIEYDWVEGVFAYDPSVTEHLAGNWDDRKLWHILLADMVADVPTVRGMQQLVHAIAESRDRFDGGMQVRLKTPSGSKHWFRMRVYKRINTYQLTDKMVITLNDIGDEADAQSAPDEQTPIKRAVNPQEA